MAGLVSGSLVGLPRMVISFAGDLEKAVQITYGVCAIIPGSSHIRRPHSPSDLGGSLPLDHAAVMLTPAGPARIARRALGIETQQSIERQRGIASSERRLKPEIGISLYRCSGVPSLLNPSFAIRSSSSIVIKTGGYSPMMNAARSRVRVSLSSRSI